jgi:tetratricopeptide (TPR) repeat protein
MKRWQGVFTVTLLSFLTLTGSQCFAQGSVGSTRGLPENSDGVHTIKGRVYFPTEIQQGSRRVKVTLKTADMVDLATLTDEDGSFAFFRLRSGNYIVTVEGGDEFEDAIETAYLDRHTNMQPANPGYGASNYATPMLIQLAIHLKPKGNAAALARFPPKAVELYRRGVEAAAKRDAAKAVEHLTAAVSLHPEFPQALNELGAQYMKLGQPEKAAESWRASLKVAPDDLGARLNYGVALLNQKKFDEAEAQLREVLKKNATLPTAHMYLGVALMGLKKLDAAEGELKLAVAPGSAEVASAHRYLGGIYWGRRDYKRAADELELYLKLAPKAADAERTRAAIKELRDKQ